MFFDVQTFIVNIAVYTQNNPPLIIDCLVQYVCTTTRTDKDEKLVRKVKSGYNSQNVWSAS